MWTHAIAPCGEKHVQKWLQTCGENNANHVDKSICKHAFMHVRNCMLTMWRATCGDMIFNMWTVRCIAYGGKHMETWLQTCGEMHQNHMEKNISREVLNDVENACKPCGQFMQTMWRATCGGMILKKWTVRCAVWREAYGDMMSSMRRMPYKPCGE